MSKGFSFPVFVMCITLSAAFAGKTAQPTTLGPISVGKALPFFSGLDLKTRRAVNGNLLLKDKQPDRHLIAFFQTTCAPCLRGLKELAANSKRLEDAKVKVTLIDVQEEDGLILPFLQRNGLDQFQVLTDLYGKSAGVPLGVTQQEDKQVVVANLPTSILVDKAGKILAIYREEGDDWIDLIAK
jgi:thiol-disulfide isomerase/thioredoxin